MHTHLAIGLCTQLACIWEATARKAGNVHPAAAFADTAYLDFLVSAAAIAPRMERASSCRVGETILGAVQATRQVARTNTNLGIILLLAPLAAVPDGETDLQAGVRQVLHRLDHNDARLTYEAIRLAGSAGLGQVDQQDIRNEPTLTLTEVMSLAADRDLVARQYVNGFAHVFGAVAWLLAGLEETGSLEGAIQYCQLSLLAVEPDSLIARKCGRELAAEATARACQVWDSGWPETAHGRAAFAGYDAWLREDGNRRNPGTTADLVAAGLFVALRQGDLKLPLSVPFLME
jgi:triphosphoribosyl-dephospho-CoA synthase